VRSAIASPDVSASASGSKSARTRVRDRDDVDAVKKKDSKTDAAQKEKSNHTTRCVVCACV
jgi:hypothetical protein